MKKGFVLATFSAIALGLGQQAFAQDVLPEVILQATRYKYLNAVDHKDIAQPVKMLERRAAEYNIKTSDYYEEDFDTYFISFFIPEGQILAAYDKDGNLLSTVERFKNVYLPEQVRLSISNRFPNWKFSNDFYRVDYKGKDNSAKKIYKVTLENGDKRMKVSIDDKGEFL